MSTKQRGGCQHNWPTNPGHHEFTGCDDCGWRPAPEEIR